MIHEKDVLVTDGAYKLLGLQELHLKPHRRKGGKKNKGSKLSKEETNENDIITETRGLVERIFGHFSKKFGMFAKGMVFKQGDAVFNIEFRICMWQNVRSFLYYF